MEEKNINDVVSVGTTENTVTYFEEEVKEIKYEDLSFWQKLEYKYYKLTEKIAVLQHICSYTALLTTVGVFFIWLFTNIEIPKALEPISIVLVFAIYAIGLLSALIACPFKLIGTAIMLVVKGFLIGLAFLGVGCAVGAMIGFLLALLLIFIAPALVTIPAAKDIF